MEADAKMRQELFLVAQAASLRKLPFDIDWSATV
jgi:hypothetical protein